MRKERKHNVKNHMGAGHAKVTTGKQPPDGYKEWLINDKIVRYAVEFWSHYDGVAQLYVDDNTGQRDIIPLKERTDRITLWWANIHI